MVTIQQLCKKKRKKRKNKVRRKALQHSPQKKVHCLKLLIHTPKKPNSARRKVAWVFVTSNRHRVFCFIPGIGHNLQKHATILIRGGHRRDLPGIKYIAVRGKFDLLGLATRQNGRSKYGARKLIV
jgi:small subunit ribosomal protein S12